jgi:hypothetical protein
MALINCSECGHQISDKSTSCVKCGSPNIQNTTKTKCFECGVELEKDEKICKNCGVDQNINEETKSETINLVSTKPKSGISKILPKLILVFALIGIAIFFFYNRKVESGSGSGSGNFDSSTYEEKVMSVEEIENAEPTKYLVADGTYDENFWGTKLKVHGIIKNQATVATYKDAVVRITYYSKTRTDLGNKEYTIYDFFPPNSEKKFELKIQKFKDVNSIGWKVISATVN